MPYHFCPTWHECVHSFPRLAGAGRRFGAAWPGTPGKGVAVSSEAPGAARSASYTSAEMRLSEIDRLLEEWRERAAYQTPAAALYARLLTVRSSFSESECVNHISTAEAGRQVQATADCLVQVLKDAQREFERVGLGQDTKPVIERAYQTGRRALMELEKQWM